MEGQDGEPEGGRPAQNNAAGPPEGGSGAKSPSKRGDTRSLRQSGRAVRAALAVPLRPFMKFHGVPRIEFSLVSAMFAPKADTGIGRTPLAVRG